MAVVLVFVVGAIFSLIGLILVSLVDTFTTFATDLPIYLESLRQYDFLEGSVDGIIESVEAINIEAILQQGIASSSSIISGASKVFE